MVRELRSVERVVPAMRVTEGRGFKVRRASPTPNIDRIDPFLLFDHFRPIDFAPGQASGCPVIRITTREDTPAEWGRAMCSG